MSHPDVVRLTEYRALRDAAWAMVHADLDTLRADLSERGVGERIKDRAADQAHEAWDGVREVASEHKGVVAGTILAIVAWLLRGPIGEGLAVLFGRDDDDAAEPPRD